MRALALVASLVTAVLAAPTVADAQIVVALGAPGAVAELDDEDRAELEMIRAKEETAIVFYVGAALLGPGGLVALTWGAATYVQDGDVWGVIALSVGSVATLGAFLYLGAALGLDLGADAHRDRWLREAGLVLDVAVRDGGGQLTLAGTF